MFWNLVHYEQKCQQMVLSLCTAVPHLSVIIGNSGPSTPSQALISRQDVVMLIFVSGFWGSG